LAGRQNKPVHGKDTPESNRIDIKGINNEIRKAAIQETEK
tara:strand:+ start:2192 stop:2311 length:120 start_codon:yes stop_codon:yes gene_type:complete